MEIHKLLALTKSKQAFLLVLSKWLKLYIEHDNVRTIPAWQVVAPESCKSSQSLAISSSISSRSFAGLVQLGQHCFQLVQGRVIRQFGSHYKKLAGERFEVDMKTCLLRIYLLLVSGSGIRIDRQHGLHTCIPTLGELLEALVLSQNATGLIGSWLG